MRRWKRVTRLRQRLRLKVEECTVEFLFSFRGRDGMVEDTQYGHGKMFLAWSWV
jgi:hypothetical protein